MTMKSVLLATALTLGATSAFAAEKYVLDHHVDVQRF